MYVYFCMECICMHVYLYSDYTECGEDTRLDDLVHVFVYAMCVCVCVCVYVCVVCCVYVCIAM
jgi:hypothetical protein